MVMAQDLPSSIHARLKFPFDRPWREFDIAKHKAKHGETPLRCYHGGPGTILQPSFREVRLTGFVYRENVAQDRYDRVIVVGQCEACESIWYTSPTPKLPEGGAQHGS